MDALLFISVLPTDDLGVHVYESNLVFWETYAFVIIPWHENKLILSSYFPEVIFVLLYLHPKLTNMPAENRPLEVWRFLTWKPCFLGSMLVFRGVVVIVPTSSYSELVQVKQAPVKQQVPMSMSKWVYCRNG